MASGFGNDDACRAAGCFEGFFLSDSSCEKSVIVFCVNEEGGGDFGGHGEFIFEAFLFVVLFLIGNVGDEGV